MRIEITHKNIRDLKAVDEILQTSSITEPHLFKNGVPPCWLIDDCHQESGVPCNECPLDPSNKDLKDMIDSGTYTPEIGLKIVQEAIKKGR